MSTALSPSKELSLSLSSSLPNHIPFLCPSCSSGQTEAANSSFPLLKFSSSYLKISGLGTPVESSVEDIQRELRCTSQTLLWPLRPRSHFSSDLWTPPSPAPFPRFWGLNSGHQACVASAFHSPNCFLDLIAKRLLIFVVFL